MKFTTIWFIKRNGEAAKITAAFFFSGTGRKNLQLPRIWVKRKWCGMKNTCAWQACVYADTQ